MCKINLIRYQIFKESFLNIFAAYNSNIVLIYFVFNWCVKIQTFFFMFSLRLFLMSGCYINTWIRIPNTVFCVSGKTGECDLRVYQAVTGLQRARHAQRGALQSRGDENQNLGPGTLTITFALIRAIFAVINLQIIITPPVILRLNQFTLINAIYSGFFLDGTDIQAGTMKIRHDFLVIIDYSA